MLACPKCGGNVIPQPVPPPRLEGEPSTVEVCLQCGHQPEPAEPPPLTPLDPTKRAHIDATYRARKKWKARIGGLCKRCGLRKPAPGYRQCKNCRRRGKPQED